MLIVILLAAAFTLFYIYRKRKLQTMENIGIPGPEPHWFFGNLRDITKDNPLPLFIQAGTKKYGDIWGYYEGPVPTIVISNPDAVKEFLVRKFSSFHGRKLFVLHQNPNSKKNVNLFNATSERWKRLRTIVNPAFTERKLRLMFPLMKKSVDTFGKNIDELSSQNATVDIYDLYKQLTLDIIGECAFGVEISCLTNNQHPILIQLKRLFSLFGRRPFLIVLAEALPELAPLVRIIFLIVAHLMPSRGQGLLLKARLQEIIDRRRADESLKRIDIVQLLLDAEVDDIESATRISRTAKALTKDEIISQCLLFLFAGYETSSTTLAFISYCLATHPDVQQRLQEEIDDTFGDSSDEVLNENCDKLANLKFMDCVINETLRLYPVGAMVVSRHCSAPVSVCGYNLPAGINVMADVQSVHLNPDIWGPVDPLTFYPERFLENENRPSAGFLSFGLGPRYCIGQRFALMEIRTTLVMILRKYTIKTCPATTIPLELNYGPTITPKGSVNVLLERRTTT